LGGNAFFTGMLGKDLLGYLIAHSLAEEGVNLDFLSLTNEAKTYLAFVTLDVQRECSFEFYRHSLMSASTPPQSLPCRQPSAQFAQFAQFAVRK
jgi:sugar/nucleoside kinase (ribokinase family)|tara:strand:+ start:262 stop:543 length:282 start_codon:yes stop_codon:yes gene_type:complete